MAFNVGNLWYNINMKIEITINGRQSKKAVAQQEIKRKRMELVLANFTREVEADPELQEFYGEDELAAVNELNARLFALEEMEKQADKMAGGVIQKVSYKLYALRNNKRSSR